MNAIDTNVLVYRFDRSEPVKRAIAKQLLNGLAAAGDTVLPWQVAVELMRQLSAWRHLGLLTPTGVRRLMITVRRWYPISLPTEPCLDRALQYAEVYSLSHWDSLIIAACAEVGVTTLYTEDMGAPRIIDTVELVNPF